MQTKSLRITALAAVVAVAIAAVALGPLNLGNLGGPGTTNGNTPQSSSIGTPTWHTSDTWTYDVNASSPDTTDTMWGRPSVTGSLTRTVVSADGSQYNVSVQGSFHIGRLIDPLRDPDIANASIRVLGHSNLDNATVVGYVLYRTSDLATVMEVRTVQVSGSIWTEARTFNASYTVKVETTYDPPLDVWSFPLRENESWNVSSNATIHVWTKWRLDGPNMYFEYGRNFTATVPIRLHLMSGASMDVTTPAGTFSAIPVRLALPGADLRTVDDRLGVVMGLGTDAFVEPRVPVETWFNGTAKNVVQAVGRAGGLRVDAVLASYHVG